MTPQEMRLAIAKATGITDAEIDAALAVEEARWLHAKTPRLSLKRWKAARKLKRLERLSLYIEVPDYLGDLNAMWWAEQVLTPSERIMYLSELYNLAFVGDQNPDTFWGQSCATAAQRAEAFCRVKYPERFKD